MHVPLYAHFSSLPEQTRHDRIRDIDLRKDVNTLLQTRLVKKMELVMYENPYEFTWQVPTNNVNPSLLYGDVAKLGGRCESADTMILVSIPKSYTPFRYVQLWIPLVCVLLLAMVVNWVWYWFARENL